MKGIENVDGASYKVSSVRNTSQQALHPGDFPFVLWFLLLPSPLIPDLRQPSCPQNKTSHGVGLSGLEEETDKGSDLSSGSPLIIREQGILASVSLRFCGCEMEAAPVKKMSRRWKGQWWYYLR